MQGTDEQVTVVGNWGSVLLGIHGRLYKIPLVLLIEGYRSWDPPITCCQGCWQGRRGVYCQAPDLP